MALAATVQESLYLKQLLTDIDEHLCDSILIYEDNQGAIALARNPVNHKRPKHIDIRYHFIREVVNCGKITLKYCRTGDMIADLMTKPVTRTKLEKQKCFFFG